ncbi:hypothetical protein EDB83DRAFT_2317412 [Lactarius deliciosus]|nr:hypothetical protein EDB83DRAFT_2317412 [Lactarius deliciosus]
MSANNSGGRRGCRDGGPQGRGNRGGRGGRGSADGRVGTPPIDLTGVPRGICSFYWSTGACDRSFDCTFKHEVKSQVLETSSVYVTDTEDQSPDFFSPEGLAINNGSEVDTQHTLRPNEAHNLLKLYLADNYTFRTWFRGANNVEGFSRIFASVNSRNKAWNSNQAQAFLDTIVRSNALVRIGDVLRFSPVAVNVGAGSSTLSYQKGYFPIIEFLSSDLVLKTTMHQNTKNYDNFHSATRECMREMIEAQTWVDRSPGLPLSRQNTLSGVQVFGTLSAVLLQYFARIKSAIKNHPELRDLVEDIFSWFNIWTAAVRASPPTFQDPITSSSSHTRNLTLGKLEKDISRLSQVVGREYGDAEKLRRHIPDERFTAGQRMEALTSRLEQIYDPPGTLRSGGQPRHDNDFTDIRNIRIAPTNEELLCPLPPYLPVLLPSAPHHLPENSMERHLDVQFRLLREELISSIRQSVREIRKDLEIMWATGAELASQRSLTLLEDLLSSQGGAYKTSGVNSVYFQLYTGARFAPLRAERRNFSVGLVLDSPPGAPRDQNGKKRAEYWENSKRLQQGSLVALALISLGRFQVFLGTIVSQGADIAESATENTIQLRISFFDTEIELMALRRQPISVDKSTFAVLIDNKIMFEALHPFLRTLKDVEPTSIPFSDFISYSGNLTSMPVGSPRYTRVPQFKYDLQCLARPGESISSVDVNNVTSVAIARQELLRSSELDPSQVEAVISTLTREISLIQGPPGTGKSFTGKEILRILFTSKIRPIVLIAFTNHALDHMLTSILDAKITTNVVRLGSRTTDERIEQYSLYRLERLAAHVDLDRPIRREYAAMKQVEEEMTRIVNRIQLPGLTWEDAERFLNFQYPQHADFFRGPPFWIAELFRRIREDEIENGEWERVANGKKSSPDEISGVYALWKNGRDIEFIQPRSSSSKKAASQKEIDSDPRVLFFNELGFKGQIPRAPYGSRSVEQLTGVYNVWSMSLSERQRLAEAWEDDMQNMTYESLLAQFDRLKEQYKDACKVCDDIQDEARRRLLSRIDLIACTTTGAAKLVSLLTSVGPKVLIVEEAGQVLEAHILASLVPSGDPKQLRPNLTTFVNVPPKALSMDSTSGRELFKFDRSLMERLSDGGMSMSQINVQRRMRPSISHFVRTILYPNLEDNEVVRSYPAVQGMEKNVVFFSHDNPENSEDDSVSKHNMFEVAMIRDLVLYFLKQGPYDVAGDIAVLCAYLGQLQKVRAALKDLKIAVSVDERDEEQLERTGLAGDGDIGFTQVQVARHIRIGTVDTFQGQEAKIVIISLVRNSGTFEEGNASIGFLKSSNRINVALSRAKHGLYILGNASNLRKNETWKTILDEMEKEDQLDHGFSIVCPRHPEVKKLISKPGELPTHAPEGGCLRPCEYRLSCGHVPFDAYSSHKLGKLETCRSVYQAANTTASWLVAQTPPTSNAIKFAEARPRAAAGRVNLDATNARRLRVIMQPRVRALFVLFARITRVIPANGRSSANTCVASLVLRITRAIQSVHNRAGSGVATRNAKRNAGSLPTVYGAVRMVLSSSFMSSGMRFVCGEPCEQQTCVICLPDECKVDIVDFIMQRRLDEIDLSSDDISERLIRLECGHIFTVETLDGHCNMSEYYESDAMGVFTAMKAPPVNFQTPPSCPACRGPITALRYGRVTKRANLDILEQNVVSTMSSAIEEVGPEIEEFSKKLDSAKGEAKSIAFNSPSDNADDLDILSARRRTRFGPESEPLPLEEISQASMTSVHGFSAKEGTAWNKVIRDLRELYKKVADVARTRGPHVQAYDAALATLYRLELSAIASDPERATDTPEPVAMIEVNKKIGQPPHKADTRFQIEAFFLTLELRYTLAEIAQSRIEGLNVASRDEIVLRHEHLWRSFVSFIYESCIRDAKKALDIAEKSSASRLAAQAGVNILRGKLELFRFEILAQRTLLSRQGLLNYGHRNQLSTKAQLEADTASLEMKRLEMTYIRSRPIADTAGLRSERVWFAQNCGEKGDKFVKEYNALATHLRTERGYEPLSLKEKEDIVKAFGFSHRGHFYNCENGHTFVIDDCGGAMESARCTECGAPIGGSNHQQHHSNTRALEFEHIAREQGAQDSPWRWGRASTLFISFLMVATTTEQLTALAATTVDHHARSVARGSSKRVVGVLLGQDNGRSINVANSFGVPFEEDDRDAKTWFLDHNYVESMFEMFKKVNARERMIGWYHTGPKLRAADLEINELFKRFIARPVMVIVDVRPHTVGIPTDAYFAVEEIKDYSQDGTETRKTFLHAPSAIEAEEAEEIGVEHLLRDIKDSTTTTLATRVSEQLASLRGLAARLSDVQRYLVDVAQGSTPVNHQVVYLLQDAFNLLPDLADPALTTGFSSTTNDALLVVYLSSLLRAVIALHALVDNKATIGRAELEEDGGSKEKEKEKSKTTEGEKDKDSASKKPDAKST